jgi:hypothetical protein
MANVLAIHAEMMKRLANHGQLTLSEWGEILEDVGNQYLEISEKIRQYIMANSSASRPLSCQKIEKSPVGEGRRGLAAAKTKRFPD